MMKTVLVEMIGCQTRNPRENHGGGLYGIVIVKELVKRVDARFVIVMKKGLFIAKEFELELSAMEHVTFEWIDHEKAFSRLFDKYRPHLFYSPLDFFYGTEFIPEGVAVVGTVHGLRDLELNELLGRRLGKSAWLKFLKHQRRSSLNAALEYAIASTSWALYLRVLHAARKSYFTRLNSVIKRSTVIFTDSNHSRFSIMLRYDVDPSKIERLTPPLPPMTMPPLEMTTLDGYGLPEKFFVVVSAGINYKNPLIVLEAFRILVSNGAKAIPDVVLLGCQSGTKRVIQSFNEQLGTHWVALPYIPRSDLVAILKRSFGLIYPTMNEGFGYPIVEAFRSEVPVISSSITSCIEVGGDAVLYFTPFWPEELAARILELVTEESTWNRLVSNGRQQLLKLEEDSQRDVDRLIMEFYTIIKG